MYFLWNKACKHCNIALDSLKHGLIALALDLAVCILVYDSINDDKKSCCFLSNLVVMCQTSNFKPIIGKLHKCFM